MSRQRLRRVGRRLLGPAPAEPLHVAAPPALLEWSREGAVPLATGNSPAPGSLAIAFVIPSFRRGSGGHATIANLVRGLEARGHRCSLWLDDDAGSHAAAEFTDFFGPVAASLHDGFAAWAGADVVVATGWQTVFRVLRLPGASGRAYLVQDHEPEFHGASAERLWAEQTYGLGLHCVCASPWLASLVADRYGATSDSFDLGVDHDVYRPADVKRRADRVIVYARAVTARRAVPLALLAMEELHRRRPGVEIALFGETRPLETRFPHTHLGVLAPRDLAAAYGEATAGVVLSTTNPSLVPTEMLACGLPVVDLASESMVATFGRDGAIELADPDPLALADAVERLLDDPALRDERSRTGRALVERRTWPAAAEQVERGLRAAVGG